MMAADTDTPFLNDLVEGDLPDQLRVPRLAAALQSMGFCLIPLRPESLQPACPWSEFQTRHPSPARLADWVAWARYRGDFFFGLVTGAVSDLVVVDVPEGDTWADQHLPYTSFQVMTPRGWQRYYRHPGGRVRTRTLAPGVVLHGDGSFVPAPGCPAPGGERHLPDMWWRTDRWSTAPVLRLPDLGEPCPERTASGATRDGGAL